MTNTGNFSNFAALESWCAPRFLHPVVVVEASPTVDRVAQKNGLTFIQLLRPFSTCQGPILSRVEERKGKVVTTTYPFGVRLTRSDCVHALGEYLVGVSEEHLRHLVRHSCSRSLFTPVALVEHGILLDGLMQRALLASPRGVVDGTAPSSGSAEKGKEMGVPPLPLLLQHLQELYRSSSSWMGKGGEERTGGPRQRPQYVTADPALMQWGEWGEEPEQVWEDREYSEKTALQASLGAMSPPTTSSLGGGDSMGDHSTVSGTATSFASPPPPPSSSPSSTVQEMFPVRPKVTPGWSEQEILLRSSLPAWYPAFLEDMFSLIRCGSVDTFDHPVGILYAVSTREGINAAQQAGEVLTASNWKQTVAPAIRKELMRQYQLVQERVWPAPYAATLDSEVHSYFLLVHDEDHFTGVEVQEEGCSPLFPISIEDAGELLIECQAITSSLGIFQSKELTTAGTDASSRPPIPAGGVPSTTAGVGNSESLKDTGTPSRYPTWTLITLNSASNPLRSPSTPLPPPDQRKTRSSSMSRPSSQAYSTPYHHHSRSSSTASSAGSISSGTGAGQRLSSSVEPQEKEEGLDPMLWVRANPPSVDILSEEGLTRVATSSSASMLPSASSSDSSSMASSLDSCPPPFPMLSFSLSARTLLKALRHTKEVRYPTLPPSTIGTVTSSAGDGRGRKTSSRHRSTLAVDRPRVSSLPSSFTPPAWMLRVEGEEKGYSLTATFSPSLYRTYCIPFPWTRQGVRPICGTWRMMSKTSLSTPSSVMTTGTTSASSPVYLEAPMYTGCFLSNENITDLQSMMTTYLAHHLAPFLQRHIATLSAIIRQRRTTTLGKFTAWLRSEHAKPKLEVVVIASRTRHLQEQTRDPNLVYRRALLPSSSATGGAQEAMTDMGVKERVRLAATSIEMQMRRCADCCLFLQDFEFAETNYKLCGDELLETAHTQQALVQPLLGAVQEGLSICQLFRKQVPHVLPSLPPPYSVTGGSGGASMASTSSFSLIATADSLTNYKCSGGACRLDIAVADYYHALLAGEDTVYPYILRSCLLEFEMCRTHLHPRPAMDRAVAVLFRLLSTEMPKQRSHVWSAVIHQLLAGSYLCMNPFQPSPIPTISCAFSAGAPSRLPEKTTIQDVQPQETSITVATTASSSLPVVLHPLVFWRKSPAERTIPVMSHLRRFVYHMHKAGTRWFIESTLYPASAQAALYCYRRLFVCCKALIHQEEVGLFGEGDSEEWERQEKGSGHRGASHALPPSLRFMNCGLGKDALRLLAHTQRSGWRAMLDEIVGKLVFLLSLSPSHFLAGEKEHHLPSSATPVEMQRSTPTRTTVSKNAIADPLSEWGSKLQHAEALTVVSYALTRNIRCHLDYKGKESVWKDVHLLFGLQRKCGLSSHHFLHSFSPCMAPLPLSDPWRRHRRDPNAEDDKGAPKGVHERIHRDGEKLAQEASSSKRGGDISNETSASSFVSGYMMLPVVDPYSFIMDVDYYKLDKESVYATQKGKESFGAEMLDKEWSLAEGEFQTYFQRRMKERRSSPERHPSSTLPHTSLPMLPSFGGAMGTLPTEGASSSSYPTSPLVTSMLPSSPVMTGEVPFVFPPYVGEASCIPIHLLDAKERWEREKKYHSLPQSYGHSHRRVSSFGSSSSIMMGSMNSPFYGSSAGASYSSFASHEAHQPWASICEKDPSTAVPAAGSWKDPSQSPLSPHGKSLPCAAAPPPSPRPPLLFTIPQGQCVWVSVSMMNPLEVPLRLQDLALIYLMEGEMEESLYTIPTVSTRMSGHQGVEGRRVEPHKRSFSSISTASSGPLSPSSPSSSLSASCPGSLEEWPLHLGFPVRADGVAPPYDPSLSTSTSTSLPSPFAPPSPTILEWNPFEKKRIRLPFYTGSLPTVPIQIIGLSWSLHVPESMSSSSVSAGVASRPHRVYEGRYYFASAVKGGVPRVFTTPPPLSSFLSSSSLQGSGSDTHGTCSTPLPAAAIRSSSRTPQNTSKESDTLSSVPAIVLPTPPSAPPPPRDLSPAALQGIDDKVGHTVPTSSRVPHPTFLLPPSEEPSAGGVPSAGMGLSSAEGPMVGVLPILYAPEHIRFGITPERASLTATFSPPLPSQLYDGEVVSTFLVITNHAHRPRQGVGEAEVKAPRGGEEKGHPMHDTPRTIHGLPFSSTVHLSPPTRGPQSSRQGIPGVGPYARHVTIQPSPNNAYLLYFPEHSDASLLSPWNRMASGKKGKDAASSRQSSFTLLPEEEEGVTDDDDVCDEEDEGGEEIREDDNDDGAGGKKGAVMNSSVLSVEHPTGRDAFPARRKRQFRAFEVADCLGPGEQVKVPVVLRGRYHSVALAASTLVTSPFTSSAASHSASSSQFSNDVMLLIGYVNAAWPPSPLPHAIPRPSMGSVLWSGTADGVLGKSAQNEEDEEGGEGMRTMEEAKARKEMGQDDNGRGALPGEARSIGSNMDALPHGENSLLPLYPTEPHESPSSWCYQEYYYHPDYFYRPHPLPGRGSKQHASRAAGMQGSSRAPSFPFIPIHAVVLHRVHRRVRVQPLLSIYASVLPPVWRGAAIGTHPFSSMPRGMSDDLKASDSCFSPMVSLAVKNTMETTSTTPSSFSALPTSMATGTVDGSRKRTGSKGRRFTAHTFYITAITSTHGPEWNVSSLIPSKEDEETHVEDGGEEARGSGRRPFRIHCGGAHALLFQLQQHIPSSSPPPPPHAGVSFEEAEQLSTDDGIKRHGSHVKASKTPQEEKGKHRKRRGLGKSSKKELIEEHCLMRAPSLSEKRETTEVEEKNTTVESQDHLHPLLRGWDPILQEPAATREFLLLTSVIDVGRMAEESQKKSSSSASAAHGGIGIGGGGLSFYRDGGAGKKSGEDHGKRKKRRSRSAQARVDADTEKEADRSLFHPQNAGRWGVETAHRKEEKSLGEKAVGGRHVDRYAPIAFTVHWAIQEEEEPEEKEEEEEGLCLVYPPRTSRVGLTEAPRDPILSTISTRTGNTPCRIRRGRLFYWIHPLSFLSLCRSVPVWKRGVSLRSPAPALRCLSSPSEGTGGEDLAMTTTSFSSLSLVAPMNTTEGVEQGNLQQLSTEEDDSWQVIAARRHQQRLLCRALIQQLPYSSYLAMCSRGEGGGGRGGGASRGHGGYGGAVAYGLHFPLASSTLGNKKYPHGRAAPIVSLSSSDITWIEDEQEWEGGVARSSPMEMEPYAKKDTHQRRGEVEASRWTLHQEKGRRRRRRVGTIPACLDVSSFSPLPVVVHVWSSLPVSASCPWREGLSQPATRVELRGGWSNDEEEARRTGWSRAFEEARSPPRASGGSPSCSIQLLGAQIRTEHEKEVGYPDTCVEGEVQDSFPEERAPVAVDEAFGGKGTTMTAALPLSSVVVLPGESIRIPVALLVAVEMDGEYCPRRHRGKGPSLAWWEEKTTTDSLHALSKKNTSRGEKANDFAPWWTSLNPNIFHVTLQTFRLAFLSERLYSGMSLSALMALYMAQSSGKGEEAHRPMWVGSTLSHRHTRVFSLEKSKGEEAAASSSVSRASGIHFGSQPKSDERMSLKDLEEEEEEEVEEGSTHQDSGTSTLDGTTRRSRLHSVSKDPFSSTARFTERSSETKRSALQEDVTEGFAASLTVSTNLQRSASGRWPTSASQNSGVGILSSDANKGSVYEWLDRLTPSSFPSSQLLSLHINPHARIFFTSEVEETRKKEEASRDQERDSHLAMVENANRPPKSTERTLEAPSCTVDKDVCEEVQEEEFPMLFGFEDPLAWSQACCLDVIKILENTSPGAPSRTSTSRAGGRSAPSTRGEEAENVSFFSVLHSVSDILYS